MILAKMLQYWAALSCVPTGLTDSPPQAKECFCHETLIKTKAELCALDRSKVWCICNTGSLSLLSIMRPFQPQEWSNLSISPTQIPRTVSCGKGKQVSNSKNPLSLFLLQTETGVRWQITYVITIPVSVSPMIFYIHRGGGRENIHNKIC